MFENEFETLLRDQNKKANGQRKEMLQRDLKGTKLLIETVLYPVLGTLDGLVLEHEMINTLGVKIYGDAFNRNLWTVFEEESYTTHAELVTRERFSFERARARTVAIFGYRYFPYSRDDLEKKPEACQREFRELITSMASLDGLDFLKLPVYERELMRFALLRRKPFQVSDASEWLQLKRHSSRKVIAALEMRGLIFSLNGPNKRCFEFALTEKGIQLLHAQRISG